MNSVKTMSRSRPAAQVRLHSSTRLLGVGLAACLALSSVAVAQVSVEWVAQTRGVSIAVDEANNVYTLDYEQAPGAEMTVTKRDVNGNLLWVASHDQTNTTQWERASWITVDSAGNAIACGTLMSGFSNPVSFASIVMKVSPDGDVLWRNVFQAGADGGTRKCLVDADDNIYVLGLGSGPPGYVTRVSRFTPAGATAWTYFDADGIGAPVNFKLTPDNQLVIAGRAFFGSINGYARIDLAGQKVWSLPGVQSLTVGDVAGDSLGNSYLVHGEYVVNGGSQIKKLDSSGTVVFDRTYGLSAFRIEVGSDDRAVACGFPNPNQGGAAFIKIDPAGELLWSNLDADGPGFALLLHSRLVLDESNDAYLAAGTLFAMAVCKVNSDGTSAWTQTTQGGSSAASMTLGKHDNSIFVVGGTTTRWTDAAEGPWENLGQGLAGTVGVPLLVGEGQLATGSPGTLTLTSARPAALAMVFVSLSSAPTSFKCGTLVPMPTAVGILSVTDETGAVPLSWTNWPGGLSGGSLYFQYAVSDGAASCGSAMSNALRADVP